MDQVKRQTVTIAAEAGSSGGALADEASHLAGLIERFTLAPDAALPRRYAQVG